MAVLKLYSNIWVPYIQLIIDAIDQLNICESIVLRLGRSVTEYYGKHGFTDKMILRGTLKEPNVVFYEYGVRFSANVLDGHKTGFFLDHRQNRKKIGDLSKGKTVLDVFSYAGGFGIHALKGGAKEVSSLDISKQALKVASDNAKLNLHSGKHITLCGDAFLILNELINTNKKYDVVIIDPPSFAKRQSEVALAKKQYARLAELGAMLVAQNGILLLASCSSRVTADDFFALNQVALTKGKHKFQLIEKQFHDIDHPIGIPEAAYLKCGYYRLVLSF